MAKTKQPPSTELILIAPELNEVAQKSGIEVTEAEKLALGYQPLMIEVLTQADLLKPLDKTNPEDAKIAKRVSLDLGKICSRLTTKKAEDKETLLIKTKLIDGLFNVANSTARLTQKDADEIVDYLAGIERERIAALANERRAELESYGVDASYLPLGSMDDEQYAGFLDNAKLAFEARKIAAEKLEADRLEQIKQAELAETERLRLQVERIEAERIEAIRVKEELAAKEAELVKERELAEKERRRIDAEIQAERKATHEKFEAEQKRVDAENKRIAKENSAKLAEQKRLSDIESKKQAELLAAEKLAADKLAKELQVKKDAEAKILADKKAAELAPDKEKVNQLYLTIKEIAIPDFKSDEAIKLGLSVKNKINELLADIKTMAANLK
jgi:ribosome-associated toxin RatA of RatAB toxin-antitoxin module